MPVRSRSEESKCCLSPFVIKTSMDLAAIDWTLCPQRVQQEERAGANETIFVQFTLYLDYVLRDGGEMQPNNLPNTISLIPDVSFEAGSV